MPTQAYSQRPLARPIAAEESTASRAVAAAGPRAYDAPLLQMRRALDRSPAVQARAALQTSLNQPGAGPGQPEPPSVQRQANGTGLPDPLKAGIERLSGIAMDDVHVHYNSTQPATVQAHAYAQGTDIHIAPGQEKHLPHEAWHVVQQKQGRVKPTLQLKGVAINDDVGLEREAGASGRQLAAVYRESAAPAADPAVEIGSPPCSSAAGTVQRFIKYNNKTSKIGVVPKELKFGYKGVQALADAEGVQDLDDAKLGATVEERIASLTKDEKPDLAKANKDDWVKPLLAMKDHIAGEIKGKELKGGHLLKLMEDTHKGDLTVNGTQAQAAVWDGTWTLKKGGADSKSQFPPKQSTMFPASWDWNALKGELEGASRVGGNTTLKNGIAIHSPGDTFYPKKSGAAGAGGGTKSGKSKKK